MLPFASRMPVSMASLLRSDSVNPFKNSSNCREQRDEHRFVVVVVVCTSYTG